MNVDLTATPPQLIRDEEVADRLGVSRRNVRELVKKGLLAPPVKLGRRTLWTTADVDACIAARIAERDQDAA